MIASPKILYGTRDFCFKIGSGKSVLGDIASVRLDNDNHNKVRKKAPNNEAGYRYVRSCKVCKVKNIRRKISEYSDIFLLPIFLIPQANTVISRRLYYCNSFLIGITKINLHKLQMVQNFLFRAITKTFKCQYILRWYCVYCTGCPLPSKHVIYFTICLTVHESTEF